MQSWLDGELSPGLRESAAAHLAACAACSAERDALESRQSEITAKLAALCDAPPHPAVLYVPRRRWPAALAGGALAASLALALGIQSPPASETAGQFLSLTDDPDPMQAGMLVRISLPANALPYSGASPASGMIQADVIVGEDGRPRAVRFPP